MELYTLHGAYALPLHHTKYDIWLWRISYVELFFTPTEFNRNMAINLKTVHRMTIQMKNCVELQVWNINQQPYTRGSKMCFRSV